MIRFYTAIGTYRLDKNGRPVIVTEKKESALDTHELLLWSSLAFRILTYQEARAEFYRKERELHLLSELDFDHYLNRLVTRRLIASGMDELGADALYDLLGHLYIRMVPNGIPARICTFFKLWISRRLPLRHALLALRSEKPAPDEKKLLCLMKHQMLSTAELVQCAQRENYRIRTPRQLMDCIYADEASDCGTIVKDGRTLDIRYPVLTAVANLYLKQRISFLIL